MSDETDNRCEYLSGTIGAELHCAHWHAADDAEFAGDRASAECCWCGDHEDGSGTCPGPSISRFAWCAVPSHWHDEIIGGTHDGGLPEDPSTPCMTAAEVARGELAAENERLRALTEGDPTSIYAEAADLRAWKESAMSVLAEWDRVHDALGRPGPLGRSLALNTLAEVERLSAENARLREALRAVLPVFDGDCYFDHHGDCQAHHADKLDGRCSVVVAREALAASLSGAGGEQ